MEINKILGSDYLDIVFDGRNKDYGAYALRKTYNERLAKALLSMVFILSLLITGYLFANKFSDGPSLKESIKDVQLLEVKQEDPKPEVLIPPKPTPVKVESVIFTAPLIVHVEVSEDLTPPDIDKLNLAVIGLIKQHGEQDAGLDIPPVNVDNRGIVSQPKRDLTNYDDIFRKVEIESSYPGGATAWMRYLNKTFRYPTEAQEMTVQGTVVVQFIVDMEGNVSDVEAIDGPSSGGLREEAVRVIRKSGKWEPAIQNGRKVKSYKKQPITFRLETE